MQGSLPVSPSSDTQDELAPAVAVGAPVDEAGGVLTIDLSAIESNWKTLRSASTPAECAAVVKANGYGLGLEPVAQRLTQAGCTTFFVADLSEGKRLRKVAPDADIYILNGLAPGTGQAFADSNLRPVIGSAAEIAEWDAFTSVHQWDGGFALHVDTGMNRLGMSVEEAAAFAPRINAANHGLKLLMSHFVAAQFAQSPRNAEQLQSFRDIRALYRGVPASIANSSGIFLNADAHLDLVRPGVALYGVNPTPSTKNPMQPVVELKVRVAQVRDVAFGETVGYDATWTARRPSRIAVVTMGYADGFFRSASGDDQKPGGTLYVAGHSCPIVGRISMDLTALDITDLPDRAVKRGDLATVIGEERDVDATGEMLGTIGYEVLTSLGRRYARVYKND
ncbi:alanine racemase [Pseudorhodoplanes sinuspersici]|uniref:Alanine racemase n=1 Tax=Pseudorhodoplanes sinuspersici TaxID=1235591 RepID=A0A1W6ZYC8_9HYPH|nr:alanine racemase [Pseudorhodoplanes sinuspersici]ARQ02151.1 alanine racemase [Pseudorhodoplanes sinuspersici]RKE73958.1 alanine racemase [Pseudorhodoplanes sinuspersici]